jgi:hypothetical protein
MGETSPGYQSSDWRRADLLQQPKQVRLAMFFNDLSVGYAIEIHGLENRY